MKRTREVVAGVRAGSTVKSGKAWAREKRLLAQLQGRDRRRIGRVGHAMAAPSDLKAGPLEKAIIAFVAIAIVAGFWLGLWQLVAIVFFQQ